MGRPLTAAATGRRGVFTPRGRSPLHPRGLGAALVLSLLACSPAHHAVPPAEKLMLPVRFSIVCIIHGDGDYLYHDPEGGVRRADEEALKQMRTVAANNPQAEVFIFHEKPRRRALLFLSHPDGQFSWYRNGELRAGESYRRGTGASRFAPEAKLFQRFRTRDRLPEVRLFFYFGHEVPEFDAAYDASYPSRRFTVEDLARGARDLAGDSGTFDLLVLSTCYGGTPHTVAALSPRARYIVASPGNLHLSWFDFRAFERLDRSLGEGDLPELAKRFARQSFDRLAAEVQTEVTVAVYDTDRVRGYLQSVLPGYDRTLASMRDRPKGVFEHTDCARDSAYILPGMSEGVEVWYRAPRFGRSQHQQGHSGWECWKER